MHPLVLPAAFLLLVMTSVLLRGCETKHQPGLVLPDPTPRVNASPSSSPWAYDPLGDDSRRPEPAVAAQDKAAQEAEEKCSLDKKYFDRATKVCTTSPLADFECSTSGLAGASSVVAEAVDEFLAAGGPHASQVAEGFALDQCYRVEGVCAPSKVCPLRVDMVRAESDGSTTIRTFDLK